MRFNDSKDPEQAMILNALPYLVSIMGAKAIMAAQILITGFIEESMVKTRQRKMTIMSH